MGCHNSKMVRVAPATGSLESATKSHLVKASHVSDLPGDNKSLHESQESLRSEDPRDDGREKSAVSKSSKRSADSGFGYDDAVIDLESNENGPIITEHSDSSLVMQVESTFQQIGGLDLYLCGVPAPRNLSARDKLRRDEQKIIEALRQEGLIAKSQTEAKCGLSFEIVEESSSQRRSRPARLSTLERSRKKRKTTAANRVPSISEATEMGTQDLDPLSLVKAGAVTMPSGAQQLAENAETLQQQQMEKEKSAVENREKRLQELRDKLKAKEAHAAAVRERKKLSSVAGDSNSTSAANNALQEDF